MFNSISYIGVYSKIYQLQLQYTNTIYKYFSITEIFKIMKLHCPYSLFASINILKRDTSNTIILPEKSDTFLYKASQLWNSVHKRIIPSHHGLMASLIRWNSEIGHSYFRHNHQTLKTNGHLTIFKFPCTNQWLIALRATPKGLSNFSREAGARSAIGHFS
jgi:hypothetical protein